MASRFSLPATWSAAERVSEFGASARAVAINNRHHAVAVWEGISAGQTASAYTGGPSWTVATAVSPGSDPAVFLSESNELFFVASDGMNGNALDGYRFTLGAAAPAEIPLGVATTANSHAQIAMVAGTAAVIWQHLDTIANLSAVTVGAFGSPLAQQISTGGDDATSPQAAHNAAQTSALAVWLEAAAAMPAVKRVWSARLTATGTWSAPVPVSQATTSALRPVVAVDDRGRAIAAWTQDGAIRSASFDPVGGWSTPTPISALRAVSSETPRVALAPGGHGLAVWAQDSAEMTINEVWAARYLAGRGWLPAARVRISDFEAGTSDVLSLAIDDAGRALVGWYQSNKVWVARFE
jgi:hypothetical protein